MGRIVLVHGNDGSDVRVNKMCKSLLKFNHEVIFLGWDRRPDMQRIIDLKCTSKHIFVNETKNSKFAYWGYLMFVWFCIKNIYLLKPDILCCVNEENAMPFLMFKKTLYKRLVCDVHDSLYDRNTHRSFILKATMKVVTEAVHNFADNLIVTDERRYEMLSTSKKRKTAIIENYPEKLSSVRELPDRGSIDVLVSGALYEGRGLRQLLTAVDGFDIVKIVVAGWPYDAYSRDVFLKNKNVKYHGVLTAGDVSELAMDADAIMAFYSPYSKNNIYASPNKIFDAIAAERPVIINSETIVSGWVRENGVGFVCAYEDTKTLREIILNLKSNRLHFDSGMKEKYCWEALETKISDVFRAPQ